MINPVIIFTFVTATFFLTNMCKAKKDKKKKKTINIDHIGKIWKVQYAML